MSTARKILWNVISQAAGKFIVTILGLVNIKLLTNYLGVSGYGEYATIYQFLAFFGIAADLGLFTIAVREMSRDNNRIPIIAGNVLGLRTALITFTMLLAIAAAFLIPQYSETRIPLGVAMASFTIWAAMVQGTLCTVLQVHLKMEYSSLALIVFKALAVGYMIFVIYILLPLNGAQAGTVGAAQAASDAGFYHMIFAGNAASVVFIGMTYYFTRKLAPIKYRFDFRLWKDILFASLPYGIALILNTFYFKIDSLLIYFFRGPTETGIYNVPMKIFEQITLLPLYFMNAVLPVLMKSIEKGAEAYNKIIQYSYDFIIMVSFPILAGGIALAYPLVFVISGPEFLSRLSEGFYGSDIALKILLIAFTLSFIAVVFSFILIAVNKQMRLLWINLAGVIFNIIANFLVIPRYGFIGAAYISVATQLIVLILMIIYSRISLHFSLKFANTFKIIFSSLAMGFAIYFLYNPLYKIMENWSVLVLMGLAAIIYFGLLLATKAITRDMLNLLRKKETAQAGDGSGTV
ncbi:flippase [Candidatus Peregrinibacteria bacterium]|nr:flippase [Candidatus Peregrinibacteria bacterium]